MWNVIIEIINWNNSFKGDIGEKNFLSFEIIFKIFKLALLTLKILFFLYYFKYYVVRTIIRKVIRQIFI